MAGRERGGGDNTLAIPVAKVTGMVRDWVKAPWTNSGMAIDGDTSAGAGSHRFFASGEYPDPLLHPRLLVTFVKNP
jgi:hypothetical protein